MRSIDSFHGVAAAGSLRIEQRTLFMKGTTDLREIAMLCLASVSVYLEKKGFLFAVPPNDETNSVALTVLSM